MLLALDSFDHYATAQLAGKGWSPELSGGASVTISPGNGRNGTASLRLQSTSFNNTSAAHKALPVPPTVNTFICGFAYRHVSSLLDTPIVGVYAGQYVHLVLWLTPSGSLVLYRSFTSRSDTSASSGTALITTSSVLTMGLYAFIEVKCIFHNTSGYAELRVNGTTVGTFTGDTLTNNATAQWSGLVLGMNNPTNTVQTHEYDDLYVCDGAATENDFLGDHRIVALVAQPGNGTHTDWVPSAGTNHGALVDEATPDIADYVSAAVVGATDTFNFPAVGVVGTVKAVQACNYAKCDVAGLRVMTPGSRPPGGPFYPAEGQLMSSEWQYAMEIFTSNPVTVADWTVAEIDSYEFGVKVTV